MSTTLDNGGSIPVMPPWYRVENKWRAARYGMEAIIILNADGDEMLVTDHLRLELKRLAPVAEKLGCSAELADVERIITGGAGYQWQHKIADAHGGDLREVVKDNIRRMNIA